MKTKLTQSFLNTILKKIFYIPEATNKNLGFPKRILVIRQHNQFGDMLVGVSLFRAIKETYPACKLTVIASNENYIGIIKNEFIDELFILNKKKLWQISHLFKIKKILKEVYDLVIVPVTVSISFTSCLLSLFSNAKNKIGPLSLNGELNKYSYMFNHKVELDWRNAPDTHYADRILDIIRPFNVTTKNFKSSVSFDQNDLKVASDFIREINLTKDAILIGMHIGAGKHQNRWGLKNYIKLIEKLNNSYNAKFFITGSFRDQEEIDYICKNSKIPVAYYLNKTIPQFAALISKSDLFITNDTGIMHVAGTTETPQISIFGPTNPFNWAPIGKNKFFIHKSELIDDVSVEDVYVLCEQLLSKKNI